MLNDYKAVLALDYYVLIKTVVKRDTPVRNELNTTLLQTDNYLNTFVKHSHI